MEHRPVMDPDVAAVRILVHGHLGQVAGLNNSTMLGSVAQFSMSPPSPGHARRLWPETHLGMIRRTGPRYAGVMVTITRVWIEEGCIGCGTCPGTCPAVFILPDAEAAIRGEARLDGMTSANRMERSALNTRAASEAELIEEAAIGCPVDVIRFER
jgi:ferredoxin